MGLDFYLSVVQVCGVASTDCWLGVSAKRKTLRKCTYQYLRNKYVKNKGDTKSKSNNIS